MESGSIPPQAINHRPGMSQFLCLKNIRLFLVACQKSFGLKEADLFEPSMLYDFTDFEMVLKTLSELSKTPKFRSKRPDIPYWPHAESQPTTSVSSTNEDEDKGIYREDF